MPVTASDIVIYAATDYSENSDDTGSVGGAINSAVRLVFTDIVATDEVEVLSDNTSDSGNLIITGRDAAGVQQTDTLALLGTNPVTGVQVFERILKMTYSAAQVGTITVRDEATNATIATLEPGVTGIRRPFINSTANATGGAQKDLYEKGFIQNNHATLALLDVSVTEVASGLFASMDFGLESGTFGSQSVTDRTTVPTGVTTFGNGPVNLPATNIGPLEYVGMWYHLTLAAGASPANSFYQFQIDGATT